MRYTLKIVNFKKLRGYIVNNWKMKFDIKANKLFS